MPFCTKVLFAKSRYVADIIGRDTFKATKGKSRGGTGCIYRPLPKQFQFAPCPKTKTLDQSPEENDLCSE